MSKAKLRYDRSIRKYTYKISDLVLVDHPKRKKGKSSGLAFRFHGPYEIAAIEPNGVDYAIKNWMVQTIISYIIIE